MVAYYITGVALEHGPIDYAYHYGRSKLVRMSFPQRLRGRPPVAYSQPAPCDLLTEKQVSAILGVSVGAGSPIANTGCSWKSTGASKVTVTVSMQTERMFAAAKSTSVPDTTKTAISGIGDEAVFTGVPNFSSLWVKKRTKFPLFRAYGLPVSEAQAKLKALAADALPKL